MKNKIAIQMDDIKSIDFDFDSSFIIGLEGQRRNYDLFYYHPDDLFIDEGEVKAKGFFLELFDQKKNYFKFLSDKIEVKLNEFKFIFLRQDPPFNMHYITSTYILDCLPKSTIVVNNPTSVRNAAEKILPFKFKEFMPATLISQSVEEIIIFFKIHKDIITKPLYGNGGEGINRSKDGKLTGFDIDGEYLDMPIMAQKYIPEINEGDRRIIFFDGDYVGSVARIPSEGSIKANFHAGGSAKKTGLVFRDKQIIDKLGKNLKKLDLFFVGIDIIGDYLTEINVTSPTGIKQINKLNNVKLEQVFWDKLEAKYKLV
ncbi:glutathione synthase [Alphaproteobacteria bacterium]|nr:glutathione synthase [Alphaproteobacteria bacterium]